MTTQTATTSSAGNTELSSEMLPVDPFRSLYVHFGMLLGVDDFQTLDAYHRGKMWYHSAWLHGKGVVHGLDVRLPLTQSSSEDSEFNGEILVSSGLAIDGVGRELMLEQAACLNLAAWYEAHKDDTELQSHVTLDETTGDIIFDGHITIESRGCLTRQVPALSESCDNSSVSTAYSRVIESVKIKLHPGLSQANVNGDYYRLRLFCGLVDARVDEDGFILDDDAQVLSARAEIEAATTDKAKLYQQWFTHFAVLDGIDLDSHSPTGQVNFNGFPEAPPAQVVLANLHALRLTQREDKWQLVEGQVDKFVRPFLLPTSIIQTLARSQHVGSVEASEENITATPEDAGGPRVDANSVYMPDTENIVFEVKGAPLMKASVAEEGLSVSAFDTRDGWVRCNIKTVHYSASENTVRVELRDAPAGVMIRLIVKGTGETPFLGRNRIPLAGGLDGPAGNIHQGNDFVFMFRARSES